MNYQIKKEMQKSKSRIRLVIKVHTLYSPLECELTTLSQSQLPAMDPFCCWWERVEGEKRKHKQQIAGILQRIRSWELDLVLFEWWNGSPKGPRSRSTQMVARRSSPSERRERMKNTLGSTQLLSFGVLTPPTPTFSTVSEAVLRRCLGLSVSFVLVWEFRTWQTRRRERTRARDRSYFCLPKN